jgi:hypothetical protein
VRLAANAIPPSAKGKGGHQKNLKVSDSPDFRIFPIVEGGCVYFGSKCEIVGIFCILYNMNKLEHFLSGYASAFDMWGNSVAIPDFSRGFERDYLALKSDWERIGIDIGKSMKKVVPNGK